MIKTEKQTEEKGKMYWRIISYLNAVEKDQVEDYHDKRNRRTDKH